MRKVVPARKFHDPTVVPPLRQKTLRSRCCRRHRPRSAHCMRGGIASPSKPSWLAGFVAVPFCYRRPRGVVALALLSLSNANKTNRLLNERREATGSVWEKVMSGDRRHGRSFSRDNVHALLFVLVPVASGVCVVLDAIRSLAALDFWGERSVDACNEGDIFLYHPTSCVFLLGGRRDVVASGAPLSEISRPFGIPTPSRCHL